MPKMKTNKSVKKRFKITGRRTVMRRSAKLQHLLSGRTPKQKRRLKRPKALKRVDQKRVKTLLACD